MAKRRFAALADAGRRTTEILNKFNEISAQAKADVLRAAYELARARIRLGLGSPESYLSSSSQANPQPHSQELTPLQREQVERVSIAIVRMVANVPWRSDCLVQALAANRWLAAQGIASQVCIGTHRGESGEIRAHAWLKVGQVFVTGGDGSDFTEFSSSE